MPVNGGIAERDCETLRVKNRVVEKEIDPNTGIATLRLYDTSIFPKTHVVPHSLGAIIRAYKSAVTYHINKFRKSPGKPIWQRNYYEHIVRGQEDLENTRNYILSYPVAWTENPVFASQN